MKKLANNNNVKIKCHRGASTEDILDHINPVIRKKPDVVIVHGGTNDLQNDIDSSKNIDKIISNVKKKSPTTNIVISNLITRRDQPGLCQKVDETNKKLEVVCRQHNVDLISNQNIKVSHLSSKKLHLNKSGSSLFLKNLVNYLNSI